MSSGGFSSESESATPTATVTTLAPIEEEVAKKKDIKTRKEKAGRKELEKRNKELEQYLADLQVDVDDKMHDVIFKRQTYPAEIAENKRQTYAAKLDRLKNAPVSGENKFEAFSEKLNKLDALAKEKESLIQETKQLEEQNAEKSRVSEERLEKLRKVKEMRQRIFGPFPPP